MTKTLSKHGNSLALVIDRPILELLNIDESTPLVITTDGQSLIVSPQGDADRKARFEQALESTNVRNSNALKRLAE
ncbi:MAG: hypothetical protein KDA93_01130 [Planctomycetaceae bacterium]|nr:hypothetical protein [Planctomycetaceae bacterium]